MLSALLFDLDGTLVDSNGAHVDAFAGAFDAAGYRVRPSALARWIGYEAPALLRHVLGDDLSDADADALARDHTDRYLARVRRDGLALQPGVRDLLRAAKKTGLPLALVTASKPEEVEATAAAARLDLGVFDAVVTARDVDAGKPAPAPLVAAGEALGVHPAATALVGDAPADGLAARRAGGLLLGLAAGGFDEAMLRRAGARRTYATAGALAADLDAALHAASPHPEPLSEARLNAWMDAALAVAADTFDEGGSPIGAVLVDPEGRIVARGGNRHHRTGSLADHAEVVTLGLAGRLPQVNTGYVLVTTLEPCRMCLGAALEARLDAVVWALEAPGNGGVERTVGPDRAAHGAMPRSVPFVRRAESRALFEAFAAREPGSAFARLLLSDTDGGPHAPYV